MFRTKRRFTGLVAVAAAAAAILAGVGRADSTPVGPLPNGPVSTIQTQKGQLVAVALPHRANGRVWRVARPYNARVLQQVGEADVGKNVVLVFRATGSGTTTIAFGLTRGETAKAYESRRFTVKVR
ncbi:MAG: hypothetical protein QOF45_2455 [Gaiellaceae bacterium]|jgi:hypothetical protein|nr:hypothetical protein [Gaiellaceae bacterium]